LKNYLIDTFNRGFGYSMYHPWTLADLGCRLEAISELLLSGNRNRQTIAAVFGKLISISDLKRVSWKKSNETISESFVYASAAISQAKNYFSTAYCNNCTWLYGQCTWINISSESIHECRHDDVLTYRAVQQANAISYSTMITCLASLSQDRLIMSVSIGTTINGKRLELPVGRYIVADKYADELQHTFTMELENLLVALSKEQIP
jgi:hypothetical protein